MFIKSVDLPMGHHGSGPGIQAATWLLLKGKDSENAVRSAGYDNQPSWFRRVYDRQWHASGVRSRNEKA